MKVSKNCKKSCNFPTVMDRSGPRGQLCSCNGHSFRNCRRRLANGVRALLRNANADHPKRKPKQQRSRVNNQVSRLMMATVAAKNRRHQQIVGQRQNPVTRNPRGNFRRNVPMEVSKGFSLWSACNVSWKELKALTFQGSFSKSGTSVL